MDSKLFNASVTFKNAVTLKFDSVTYNDPSLCMNIRKVNAATASQLVSYELVALLSISNCIT